MGNHFKNYTCNWVWGSDPDPEENKKPPMRSKLQFSVKPNSFKHSWTNTLVGGHHIPNKGIY